MERSTPAGLGPTGATYAQVLLPQLHQVSRDWPCRISSMQDDAPVDDTAAGRSRGAGSDIGIDPSYAPARPSKSRGCSEVGASSSSVFLLPIPVPPIAAPPLAPARMRSPMRPQGTGKVGLGG
eukprot:356761-Chlamydomonas_euryale.AAC.6